MFGGQNSHQEKDQGEKGVKRGGKEGEKGQKERKG